MGKTAAGKKRKETPLMGQYNRIKQKYPDAVLLFRVGDFYETFGEDAVRTSRALGIVLTKRANGSASEIELAGFPYHALDNYMPKLVKAGLRVAICEQLEDPKLTKTIVKRGVTELITPGVALNDKLLDHKANNYLASVYLGKKDEAGVAFLDVSTGEFLVAEGGTGHVDKLLRSLQPAELIYAKPQQKKVREEYSGPWTTFALEDWVYNADYAEEQLTGHFQSQTVKGLGLDGLELALIAAGGCLHYLSATEHRRLDHIRTIRRIHSEKHVWLDRFTMRNLELLYSPHEEGISLLRVVDHTLTPMGARMMRHWLALPLLDLRAIETRHDRVEAFIRAPETLRQIQEELRQVNDLERLASKIAVHKIQPRELLQLAVSAKHLAAVRELMAGSADVLKSLASGLRDMAEPASLIGKTIRDDAPALASKGNVIATGVDAELDDLRKIATTGKAYLDDLQEREIQRTGITSLKVGFNNVFGYYLEVRNTHKSRVPETWIRKQTLVSAERYITPELKEYEQKILGAEGRIAQLEARLYEELMNALLPHLGDIQHNARLLAEMDCLQSFAALAVKHQYRRPEMTDGTALEITQGRHPVIEQQLPPGEQYVPNDISLDAERQQIMIITGPNMAGKSALLRQTALICLLAQTGSFVPAESARLGLVDKVFTRVGASDNISAGESTFMIEMIETATIMHNVSARSLVLLDEIGRGTSTYDGISIAWSLVEYLHNHPSARAKTLFATHYHELNELENKLERVRNFHVSTREAGNKVIFLRKLVQGGTEHSFGIHVARMAGMPQAIVDRAGEVLEELEEIHRREPEVRNRLRDLPAKNYQLSIFEADDPRWSAVREKLNAIDINATTPMEALLRLQEIKQLL